MTPSPKREKSKPSNRVLSLYQVLNLAAKLCLTNPKQTKLLTQYVLNLAKYDMNYDIRDRQAISLFLPQTSHNIDCVLGSLCYIRTVFHLNCLTAQLSYEGRAAVEEAK
jgi:hypothetical protein